MSILISYAIRTRSTLAEEVDVESATSSAWQAGPYKWFALVTKDGQRTTAGQGELEILEDLTAMADGADLRPHVKRVLDAIEAALSPGSADRADVVRLVARGG